jgi:hypothetical protein
MTQTVAAARHEPQTDLSEIAVAVPVLSRSEALAQFIESVPAAVSRVVVADNGLPGEHTHVYARDWHVDIDVLDLDHDIGIGACRAALTEDADEPYLWMGDSDMRFVDGRRDLARLREILDSDAQLGGVSGWLVEGDTVRSGARDLMIVGDTLVKDGTDPTVEPDPYPHARFDFIPHAGLFRREVFETHSHDPELRTYEHADFFLGQCEADVWRFASTPAVQVVHNRWIDAEYRSETRGEHDGDREVLAEKWGVNRVVPGAGADWSERRGRSTAERAFDAFRAATPARVWVPVRQALKRAGVA